MKKFNKTVKKAVAVCLVLLIAAGCLANGKIGNIDLTLTASAEVLKGTVSNLTWEYDTETKTLTLGGSGNWNIDLYQYASSSIRQAEKVVIGSAIDGMDDARFTNFQNIKSFSVDENNEYLCSDDFGILYNKDKSQLIRYPFQNEATQITVAQTVTSINKYAFYNSKNLTSITLPDGLVALGNSAFRYCKALTEITLPDTVETMSDSVFYGASALKIVHLPDKITEIPSHTFDQCIALTQVDMPANLIKIADAAFYQCINLKGLELSASVTTIEKTGYTFAGIPDPVTVDENNLYFSNDENGVLYNKNKTELLHCPNYENTFTFDITTELGEYAFAHCGNLTSVTFSDNVTAIPYGAFYRCSKLNVSDIPKSIASIGEYAFYYCSNITEITVPYSVQDIGRNAFSYCDNLKSATLNCNITVLPSATFIGDAKLSKVVLPDSITEIGVFTFVDCTSLTDIYFKGSKAQWDAIDIHSSNDLNSATIHYNYQKVSGDCGDNLTWSFDEVLGLLTIEGNGTMYSYNDSADFEWNSIKNNITGIIMDGAENIGKNAFNGCANLKEVMLGNTTITVEDYAFANCINLTVVTLPHEGNVDISDTAFENHNSSLTLIADTLNSSTSTYANNNSITFIPVSYDAEKKILSFSNIFTVYQNIDYYFLNYYILKNSDCEYLHFDKLVFDGVLTDSMEAQEFENLDPDARYLTFVDLYVSIKAVDQDGERLVSFGEMLKLYEEGNYDAFKLITETDDGKSEETLIEKTIARILLIASKVVNFFRRMFR